MKSSVTWLTLIFTRFIFACSLSGQAPPDELNGLVLDATSKVGIPGVNIILGNTGTGTTTDATGKFSLTLLAYPARIVFQHISYFPDTLLIADSKEFKKFYAKTGGLLFLRANVFQIGEVTVSAKARKLFEEEPFAIIDYQFLNNKIIAIGYRNYNEFKKEILVADLNGKVLWSRPKPEIRELYKDCLGDVYLVEKNHARQIMIWGDSIAVKSSCHVDFFNDFVRQSVIGFRQQNSGK